MDEEIISRLFERDESALEIIRREYGGLCLQVAGRILGSREDAEECLSDVLLEIWNAIPPRHPAHFRAFLMTIVRRRAINRLEHETAKKRGSTQYQAALEELAELLPSKENVEAECDQRLLNDALHSFLATISPRSKRIFLQRYYSAASVAEIAADLGMQTAAVKMHLMRTRNAFRNYLEKEGLL